MDTKRTSYTQLPEVKELEVIMRKEAKREIQDAKKNSHYPKFDSVNKWMERIGIKTNFFKSRESWQEKLVNGNKLVSEVVEKTLSKNGELETVFNNVTNYLGEEDKPKPSDLIFVFGSKSLLRIEKAIQLYKSGFAPKIFITGGHPFYEKSESEAEVFRKHAMENGIPEKDLIIDPESITIADNVRRSLNLFDKWGLNYNSMIIVTNWFAMRRSWVFMMKYTLVECKLIRVLSDVDPDGSYSKHNWYKNESGIKVVFNEFVKMKIGTLLNTC